MTGKQRSIAWKPLLANVGEHRRRRLHGIYSLHQLQDIILYEKSRSDRKGTTLSLAVFDVGTLTHRQRKLFIDELLQAVRTTDHVGWFDRNAIAVVLPFTAHDGAGVFLTHARQLAWPSCIPASLYSYPDRWTKNADNSHSGDTAQEPTPTPSVDFVRKVPGWKRILDIGGASLGLVLLSPLLVLTAIVIKAVSPGPVFFRQTRVGLARRPFSVLKFRTMHQNNAVASHANHAKDLISSDKPMKKLDGTDPRIILGGRVLRTLAIDELPQLINVLKGEMSLVGPRPCLPYESDEYQRWHTHRFSVLPGLSGLWQVSGKNNLTFAQMIRLDIEYEKRLSLWLDLQIIVRTPLAVFAQVLAAVHRRAACAANEAGQQYPAIPVLSAGSHGSPVDGCED